jgi:hypothetical protein
MGYLAPGTGFATLNSRHGMVTPASELLYASKSLRLCAEEFESIKKAIAGKRKWNGLKDILDFMIFFFLKGKPRMKLPQRRCRGFS